MKDHQIAEIVNALRDAAITHHASGQLRERLRSCIEPLLLAIAPPVAAGSVDTEELISGLRRQYKRALDSALYEQQRAEKAEARLAIELERIQDYYTRWRCERENPTNTHRLDTWQAACGKARAERDKAEARVKELEIALTRIGPFNLTVD